MTSLERLNAARSGRGLRALAPAELEQRNALLARYEDSRTTPAERNEIRASLRNLDRPEERRTAGRVPAWLERAHDGRLAACGADG